MYKHFILFALSIALISSFVLAGVTPQKGKARVDAGKVKDARVKTTDPSGCPSPRPKNRGCSVACKPCFVPVCENGKWKYEKLEQSKEECTPRPLPGGSGGVCTIGKDDFCPAECKKCVRK
jgi:hypothetical protein